MTEALELTVPELDCAEEAQQIEAALRRLPGVEEVRTAGGARKAVVAYRPERIQPDAIRDAIRGLGMTIADPRGPSAGRRRSLPDLSAGGSSRWSRSWRSSGSSVSAWASSRR